MGRWAQARDSVSPRTIADMGAFPTSGAVADAEAAPHGAPARSSCLFIHTATRPPLGADTWVHAQILANLDPSTHEVHVACATGAPGAPTPTYEAFRQIPDVAHPSRALRRRADLRLAGRRSASGDVARRRRCYDLVGLARYIRRHRIDDHPHQRPTPRRRRRAWLLGRLTGATSIVHAHVGYGEWMSPMLKWALRHADVRIAISAFVAEHAATRAGTTRAAPTSCCNGIDPSEWTPRPGRDDARRELGIPRRRAGRSSRRADCSRRRAQRADPRARRNARAGIRDVRLLIVGREMVPGYAAELAALAAELGVADRVTLLGHRTDVSRLMAAADVFAMPSLGEPFGLVYVEAMAMELPVVALDSGGAPEVVQHGVTGLLSAPGRPRRPRRQPVARSCPTPTGVTRMGANGRRRVETHFTSARMADDVADVYRGPRPPEPRRTSYGHRSRRRPQREGNDAVSSLLT